jgi:hypothetical protein
VGAAGAGDGADAVPARQSATYAFSVIPLAWKLALSARHSSTQALAVFWPELVAAGVGAIGLGAGAAAVGAGGAAAGADAVPARQSAT